MALRKCLTVRSGGELQSPSPLCQAKRRDWASLRAVSFGGHQLRDQPSASSSAIRQVCEAMSLFFGVLARNGAELEPAASARWKKSILGSLSSDTGDLEVFEGGRCFLANYNLGAFDDPGFLHDGDAGVALLTGQPILQSPSKRSTDLRILARQLARRRTTILRQCRGSFAICLYHRPVHSIFLATDALGIRPVFYHAGKRHLFFSTSLRLLEALPEIPKRLDLPGIAEASSLGYSLCRRTPYADIKVLQDGEYLFCGEDRVKLGQYFSWTDVRPFTGSRESFLERAYDLFRQATVDRAGSLQTVPVLLSGGLDSRCVVAALRSLGRHVLALTIDTPGMQDIEYATRFASVAGAECRVLRPVQSPTHIHDAYRQIRLVLSSGISEADRGVRVFTGDGGSVTVGGVFMSKKMFDVARQRGFRAALADHFRPRLLPRRFMRGSSFRVLHGLSQQGVLEEVRKNQTDDPARALYLYFVRKQRRAMYGLLDRVPGVGIDFTMPFFDTAFVRHIVSGPVDELLRHSFYHSWLKTFPSWTREVPWQTYPGHIKCPVAGTSGARDQWQRSRLERFAANSALVRQTVRVLRSSSFPASYFHKDRMALAVAAHALGIRDFSYVFRSFVTFARYFGRCNGVVGTEGSLDGAE